jgi:hypothetical protein
VHPQVPEQLAAAQVMQRSRAAAGVRGCDSHASPPLLSVLMVLGACVAGDSATAPRVVRIPFGTCEETVAAIERVVLASSEQAPLAVCALVPKADDDDESRSNVAAAMSRRGYTGEHSWPHIVAEGTPWAVYMGLNEPVEIATFGQVHVPTIAPWLWYYDLPYCMYFGNSITIAVPRRCAEQAFRDLEGHVPAGMLMDRWR